MSQGTQKGMWGTHRGTVVDGALLGVGVGALGQKGDDLELVANVYTWAHMRNVR